MLLEYQYSILQEKIALNNVVPTNCIPVEIGIVLETPIKLIERNWLPCPKAHKAPEIKPTMITVKLSNCALPIKSNTIPTISAPNVVPLIWL